MDGSSPVVSIDTVPASEGWGFLGRILVGDVEVYRTVRAYALSSEALHAMTQLLAGVLGPRLAGQEWQQFSQLGHIGVPQGLTNNRTQEMFEPIARAAYERPQ